MNLDDLTRFASLDTRGRLARLDAWPEQLLAAEALSRAHKLPARATAIRQVLFTGRGDSGLAGALALQAALPDAPVPLLLWSSAPPPLWLGPDTLVIALSHSGNTPETLMLAETAVLRGAPVLALTSGGRLAALPAVTVWRYPAEDAPDGFVPLTALAVTALQQLGVIEAELNETVEALRAQQAGLNAASPVMRNPAKRMAGQFLNRQVALFVADELAPAGQWWAGQVNQQAKAWAQCVPLAESDHLTAGRFLPEGLSDRTLTLFLRGAAPSPAVEALRLKFMTAGYNTDSVAAVGAGRLAQLLTLAHYGGYVAFYLAMAYGVDPAAQID